MILSAYLPTLWLGIEYLLTTAPLFVVAWVAVAVVVAAGAGRLASRR